MSPRTPGNVLWSAAGLASVEATVHCSSTLQPTSRLACFGMAWSVESAVAATVKRLDLTWD